MAFEKRGDQYYFYTSHRVGQKVKKTYHGRRHEALLIETQLRKKKEAHEKRRQEAREEVAREWPMKHRMQLTRDAAKEAMRAAYLGAGYTQSACYHWRKPTNGVEMNTSIKNPPNQHAKPLSEGSSTVPEAEAAKPAAGRKKRSPEVAARTQSISQTIRAIESGQTHLRSELRRLLLEEDPDVWRTIADVTRVAMDQWAARISPNCIMTRESILLTAVDQRKLLTSDMASPIERVLADRLVLAKLQNEYFSLRAAAMGDDPKVIGSKVGEALAKRVKSANHELSEAVRHYEKAQVLKSEISPKHPNAGAAALRIYKPESESRKVA